MSKERLKEIKQHQYDGYTIWDMGEDNLVWLIEQAERVQELEEAIADYAYEIGKRKRALNKKRTKQTLS